MPAGGSGASRPLSVAATAALRIADVRLKREAHRHYTEKSGAFLCRVRRLSPPA